MTQLVKILRIAALVACAALIVYIFAAPSRNTKELAMRKYPNRIPVRFWHMWSAQWKAVVDKIVDRYNESQDKYEVIPLSVPGGADAKFLLGSMGGDPPDVMAQWNPVIPTWGGNGMIVPYEEIMTPEELAKYNREVYPIVKRIGMYNGKTYGIPIGCNVSVIYYLPQAFRDAGLDPDKFPKTYEEMVEVSKKLTKRNAKGEITRLGYYPANWQTMVPIFGSGFYDYDKKKLTLGNPANEKCLESLVDIRKRDGYEDVLRFQSGLNTSSFAAGWPFIGGAYAITVDGAWRVEQMAKYAPNLEYRTITIPPPAGGTGGGGLGSGNFMIIPRSAREKAGAWDFVKFWSGLEKPERAAEFYTWGGWLPLSEAVANAPVYKAYVKKYPQFGTFVDAVKSSNVQALPPVAYQVFIGDQIQKDEDLAIRGTITPQQAVTDLETSVAKEAARRKKLGFDE